MNTFINLTIDLLFDLFVDVNAEIPHIKNDNFAIVRNIVRKCRPRAYPSVDKTQNANKMENHFSYFDNVSILILNYNLLLL